MSGYSGVIRVRFIGNVTNTSLCDVAIDNFAVVDGKNAADFEITSESMDACAVFELENKTAIPMTASQWSLPGTPGVDYEFINGTTDRSKVANVRFFDAGQKTIHLLATTQCGRSAQTQTINVTPGVAKLDFDVSADQGTAWCTIFELRDMSPLATTDWTWGIRRQDGSTAREGVDYGYMMGDRRANEVDVMFYKPGLYDIEFYANAGCDSSKTIVIKQVQINPEDPGPTTTDDNLSGPGVATLTATGNIPNSDIFWYDKERNGTQVGMGNTFNPAVNTTTTFWARELLNIQDDIFTNTANNGLTSTAGNYLDVKNESPNVVKITSIDFNIRTTVSESVELWVYQGRFRDAAAFGNPSAWTQILNTTVTAAGYNNYTPVSLPQPFEMQPNTFYAFYWYSTGGVGYISGSSEGSVYATDGILSIHEGMGVVSGFPTSGNSPRVFSGRIHYEIGGCETAPSPATAYVGNVPPLSILPANGNDRRSADWSVVEGPWTHYYDNNGTPGNIADDYACSHSALAVRTSVQLVMEPLT
ncbi:MAG: hypothetical protein R3B47_18295 [Bacteroidia bacterium]